MIVRDFIGPVKKDDDPSNMRVLLLPILHQNGSRVLSHVVTLIQQLKPFVSDPTN